jgi:hypothetical protein
MDMQIFSFLNFYFFHVVSEISELLEPAKWKVNDAADFEKLARKCDIEDYRDLGVNKCQFSDPFLWTEDWDKPFSSKNASNILKYRDGYVLQRPKKQYRDYFDEMNIGFLPFNKYQVNKIFISTIGFGIVNQICL